MENKKVVQVVAALFWRKDRFMACRRPAHKARGLLWEFVGGKVEPGETKKEALIRECKEELDIGISVGRQVMAVTHTYPDITIQLTLFESYILSGEPKLLEHCDLKWITVGEIANYEFCPADEVILNWLKSTPHRALNEVQTEIQGRLFAACDEEYKRFHSKLIPNIMQERIIGVRMPQIKKLAKIFAAGENTEDFIKALPHDFYEENNIHGMMIARESEYEKLVSLLDAFLPFVDNWATCDSIRPKLFAKRPKKLPAQLRQWIMAGDTYTVRFGMEMLMAYYLDDAFEPVYLDWVAVVHSNEYYVQMMQAWYFATALAKQWQHAIVYLENKKLDAQVHRKTIQKALESNRLSEQRKAYLRTLK